MTKDSESPPALPRRNTARLTNKSSPNPKSPTMSKSKKNTVMTTPKINNTTTLASPFDQNSTLKSSEKPPEEQSPVFLTPPKTTGDRPSKTVLNAAKPPEHLPQPTADYKKALSTNIDIPLPLVIDPTLRSTFLLQKELCDNPIDPMGIADDITVEEGSREINEKFPNNIRMTMMFKVPTKEEGCTDNDAPFAAIKKINEMLKPLTNKLPCRVGPWTFNSLSKKVPSDTDLLTVLPKNIDFVESYVYDYNRFLSPGKTGYVRLNIYYSDLTSVSDIQSVVSQFKKARERFMEVAHSNALSPVQIGTLTGSVKAMAASKDFKDVMKKKFDLSELGLWFGQPRTSNYTGFDSNKSTLHLEIDRKDLPKRQKMELYFNHGSRNVQSTFFGTPMLLTKAFDYFAEDDVKENMDMHARKQTSLGKSIRSTTIHGVQLNNWASRNKDKTLLHELMCTESITDKKIIKGKKSTTFKGRLFYAIIPDKVMKSVTFYYSRANYFEGRSVARGLPLFIKDHFLLDPAFFCTSEAITDALDGDWNFESRRFLSSDERIERERLDLMEDEVNAEREVFISKDHQRALAMDEDDEISVETRLTKGDAAPPAATTDDVSEMTGSTRESKAKAYAESAVNEVAKQYTATISTMNSDLGAKEDKIAQLELLLSRLTKTSPTETDVLIEVDNNHNLGEEDLAQDAADHDTEEYDLPASSTQFEDDSTLSKKRTSAPHSSLRSQSTKHKFRHDDDTHMTSATNLPHSPTTRSSSREDMSL